MKKISIEVLQAEIDYLSSSLRNIRSQIKVGKKILSESQKKYDDLLSTYGAEVLTTPELSARFIEKLSLLKDEKYINFANSLAKNNPASQIDEILSDLTTYPDFIKRLQAQKKKIGKKYYKNLVRINKYSR